MFSTAQMSVGANHVLGHQRSVGSYGGFHGCLENLNYNGLNLIDLAKRKAPQVTVKVMSLDLFCVVWLSSTKEMLTNTRANQVNSPAASLWLWQYSNCNIRIWMKLYFQSLMSWFNGLYCLLSFFDLTKLLDDIGAFTFIKANVALIIMLMRLRPERGRADEISVHQDSCSNPSLSLPSSSPLLGKCNFILCWACFCCRDLQRPQELPVFAWTNRVSLDGHINQASVSHVERGRAAADL